MINTVSYEHTNTYEVLYPINPTTKNIWVCFHGLGYLSRFFKRYFENFDFDENAIIVPQAPSKFYLGDQFKHVGASWLTRVDTEQEMKNNLNYIDGILSNEAIAGDPRIILMGFSQGVSIATRYLKHYKQPIKALIMHSGSIPAELDQKDGELFRSMTKRCVHIAGKQDEYLSADIIEREENKLELLFGKECELHRPDIKHVVDAKLLMDISKSL